jgi:hypothetical protein
MVSRVNGFFAIQLTDIAIKNYGNRKMIKISLESIFKRYSSYNK